MPGTQAASVSGIVSDEWDRPISGVLVSFDEAARMTDGSGRYAFSPADFGEHKLRLQREGYRFTPEHEPRWFDEDFYALEEPTDAWGLTVWGPGGVVVNFFGFLTTQLRAGDSVRNRLHPREPGVVVTSTDSGGFIAYCVPCQVLEVTVERPGHLFVEATWPDDLELALWVDGLPDPNVGHRRLLRDVPVNRAGTVRGFLGRAGTWARITQPVDLVIQTRFVPD